MRETPQMGVFQHPDRGMVVVNNGARIGGINDTPDDIGFLGYVYSRRQVDQSGG